MTPDDAEEYTAALGQVVGGGYRQVALGVRLGVPTALGITTREWVEDRLGGYVRLAVPERREAVAELVAEGMTQRQVADVLGVTQPTVHRDSNESRSTGLTCGDESAADSFESLADHDCEEALAIAEEDNRLAATRNPQYAPPPLVQALRVARAELAAVEPSDVNELDETWRQRAAAEVAGCLRVLNEVEERLC